MFDSYKEILEMTYYDTGLFRSFSLALKNSNSLKIQTIYKGKCTHTSYLPFFRLTHWWTTKMMISTCSFLVFQTGAQSAQTITPERNRQRSSALPSQDLKINRRNLYGKNYMILSIFEVLICRKKCIWLWKFLVRFSTIVESL